MMMIAKFSLVYCLIRLAFNAAAIGFFLLALKLQKVNFSWMLYWSAFVVYVILSVGDALLHGLTETQQ